MDLSHLAAARANAPGQGAGASPGGAAPGEGSAPQVVEIPSVVFALTEQNFEQAVQALGRGAGGRGVGSAGPGSDRRP